MAMRRTSATSVGVVGWCSASMESNRVSKSASLSPGKTKSLAVSPCLRPLRRTAARPSGVVGPVLFARCGGWRRLVLCGHWEPDRPGVYIVAWRVGWVAVLWVWNQGQVRCFQWRIFFGNGVIGPDSSSERMYTRPPPSPATMRCSSTHAQQSAGASQWNVAMSRPVSKSQTFSV